MSWKHALVSLWLIATALWSIGWAILIRQNCNALANGQLWCRAELEGWLIVFGEYTKWTQLQIYLVGFTLPAAVLVVGALLVWLGSRFVADR